MGFNADRLEMNAVQNRVKIDLRRAAVSDREGEIDITWNSKVPFTAGASLIRKKGPKLTVPTLTIDSLKLDQVTAIKIDVERAEPLVLAGARETLKRCKPLLLVEALGPDERAAVLASIKGYKLADIIDVRNLVLVPK
jgi:FkbM family methyltransferase